MARTLEQLTVHQLGALQLQVLALTAQCEQKDAELAKKDAAIAQLNLELVAAKRSD